MNYLEKAFSVDYTRKMDHLQGDDTNFINSAYVYS